MPEIEVADVGAILRFGGDYRWLSNFYVGPSPVRWDGRKWRTAEHAFQAAKCTDPEDIEAIFRAGDPGEAKRLGRQADMREDWDRVKKAFMLGILRSKFRNPGLKSSLLRTGDNLLVEGNIWHDNVWGVCFCTKGCSGAGWNLLGRLLMTVRSELTESR